MTSLQQAAGRTNPRHIRCPCHRAWNSLHRLSDSWSHRGQCHGRRTLGGRFPPGQYRIGKLLKWFVATPMPRRDFLLSLVGARLTFVIPDVWPSCYCSEHRCSRCRSAATLLVVSVDMLGSLAFAGIGPSGRQPGHDDRDRQRAHEPGHAAHVVACRGCSSRPTASAAIQPLIQALPLTQLVTTLRRVILEGVGLVEVSGGRTILAAWAVLTFVLALRSLPLDMSGWPTEIRVP